MFFELMFCSDYSFSPVISGVSGAVTRPCYRTWRGKAHAAPLSSQDPPKGQKREFVSKKERKARIEEFVEMYVPRLSCICDYYSLASFWMS